MNHKELKKGYIKIYKQMMKYIWSFQTVEILADLEVSVCNVFPIMSDVRNNFYRLETAVRNELKDNEDMKDAFDAFKEIIKSEVSFANITFVEE